MGTTLLTTYRRSGEGVATPVSITLAGDRLYFVTAADSGKAKRLAHTSRVSTDGVEGHARLLQGGKRRLLRPTTGLFWSYIYYRLRGKRMNLYEVTSA